MNPAVEWAKFGAEWILIFFLVFDVRKAIQRLTTAVENLAHRPRRHETSSYSGAD